MSVTSRTGRTRRYQVLPPSLHCRDATCRALDSAGAGAPRSGLDQLAAAHQASTGHQVAVTSASRVIWGGPPVPPVTYDAREPSPDGRTPGAVIAEDIDGQQLNELIDARGGDVDVTRHPDYRGMPR